MAENIFSVKKRQISLSLSERRQQKAADAAAKDVIPKSTQHVNDWAYKAFNDWRDSRNTDAKDENKVPMDLLLSSEPEIICKWLSRFVLEVRQQRGDPYSLKSIHSILAGLFRISKSKGATLNFLDKSDQRFVKLHNTLDTQFSKLHAEVIGAQASIISYEDEAQLMHCNVMSYANPKSLLNLVFFYTSLHCCLIGGQEQHDLSWMLFERFPQDRSVNDKDTYYFYTEFISKNCQHRFEDLHSKNKTVKIYSLPSLRSAL